MTPIDVVIPVYNAQREWLLRAVRSAFACEQLAPPGPEPSSSPTINRIIIVDDGSRQTVGPELLAAFDRCDRERIDVVRQPNSGPSAARNRGLSLTTTDWVLLLDADDELVPAGIADMVAIGGRESASCVQGWRIEVREDGITREMGFDSGQFRGRQLSSPHDVWRPIPLFGASGLLVSQRLITAGVRFDTSIHIQEDREFLFCAATSGVGPVCVTHELTLRVLRHAGHASLTSPANLARRVRDHLALLERRCPHSLIHINPEAAQHWRRSTAWLINALSKSPAIDDLSWARLTAAARERGWHIPLKCRIRARARTLLRRARMNAPAAGGASTQASALP